MATEMIFLLMTAVTLVTVAFLVGLSRKIHKQKKKSNQDVVDIPKRSKEQPENGE